MAASSGNSSSNASAAAADLSVCIQGCGDKCNPEPTEKKERCLTFCVNLCKASYDIETGQIKPPNSTNQTNSTSNSTSGNQTISDTNGTSGNQTQNTTGNTTVPTTNTTSNTTTN